MRRSTIAVALVFPLLALAQEKKDSKVEPIPEVKIDRKDPVLYEKDIEPILANKCFVCHTGKEVSSSGKLDMATYEKLIKGGKHGPPIVAGKSTESYFYKLCSRQMKPMMPPKDETPLVPNELALVKLWIDQGAKPPTGMGLVRPKVVLSLPPALVKPVRAIAVSPDGKVVASGRGNQIHLFKPTGEFIKTLIDPNLKLADGKEAKAAHISLVESMAFSHDGKLLASGSFQEMKIWDPESGAVKQTLTGFADRVVTMHFSADGKYLATGGGAATEDGEIKVFDVTNWKPVGEYKSPHSDTVLGVCFSPDSKMLATCGADKFVKVWEIPSGKFLKSFEGHTHHVLDVGWKPDGKLLASGGADNAIKIWDFEKGEQVRTVQNAHTKQITRLWFVGKTPTFLTASGDASAKLWNVDNGNAQRTFSGATDFLFAVSASQDGKVIATGGEEGVVRIYNGDSGALVKAAYPPGDEPKKEEPKKEEPKKK
jgi:WD40 repeat protein